MEQIYLIETFIDKVTIFVSEEDETSSAKKNLIVKIKFGPKVQFIVKEGQLAPNKNRKEDVIECDKQGRRKWSRTIRVGKSYLFPSYPDTVLMILSKFPLEIEVWNDDENEVEIFVGVGTMQWDTEFFFMLKESADAGSLHTPLTIKTVTSLTSENCGKQVGEVSFILRLSALGDSIITEYQQLMTDPETFVFRTNKAPSMFQCKLIEGNDPNFCMVGSLYESTTLEDPNVVNEGDNKIEICTQLQSCGAAGNDPSPICQHKEEKEQIKNVNKKYPIDKIRMGDITGPCGNTSCPLAHKVRNYIRTLDTYKAAGKVTSTKNNVTKKVCGSCVCKDDRYHREDCPDKQNKGETAMCTGCGGTVHPGHSCEDKRKTQVTYVYGVHKVTDFKESMFGRSFLDENLAKNYICYPLQITQVGTSKTSGCICGKSGLVQPTFSEASCGPDVKPPMAQSARSTATMNPVVYNVDVNTSKGNQATYCTNIPEEKDCKCNPPKPAPPCRTFDCDCITEMGNKASRKAHKPYCPSYKHKIDCPVTLMNQESEEEIEEVEALPYGLPPIELGPCPIMGRPCSVPDGFAKMYKSGVAPTLPPSFSEAGKISCSKEFVRIKNALKDYMKHEKENDFRCINKFNVDIERRCCDKENRILALTGKACCGSHKLAIQEKFREEKK